MVYTGPRTGRFGWEVTGGLFSARFNAREHIHLVDQVTGFFRGGGFNRGLAEAHENMAEQVQERAVEILRRRVAQTGRPQLSESPRPGREANRLETSILNEYNRFASASGFLVGRPDWLEQSPAALYYRIIEEGGTPYVTSGFFFAPGGKAELPSSARDAIKLHQTARTSGKPFTFLVAGTPAYQMHEGAGEWWADQRQLIFSVYNDVLNRHGLPVPLKHA